jgi:hypothetical protein
MAGKAFATTERVYPFFTFNAIGGYWVRVDGRAVYREPVAMTEEQNEERITDNMVDAMQESQQIRTRREIQQRARRKARLITVLLAVGVVIVWGAVVWSAVLR